MKPKPPALSDVLPPCVCTGEDAAAADAFLRKAEMLAELRDDSHFRVVLRQCACGRRYLRLFFELVDWANGDDSQASVMAPISSEEMAKLEALPRPVEEVALMELISPRRQLVRAWPRDGVVGVSWRTEALVMLPHD